MIPSILNEAVQLLILIVIILLYIAETTFKFHQKYGYDYVLLKSHFWLTDSVVPGTMTGLGVRRRRFKVWPNHCL